MSSVRETLLSKLDEWNVTLVAAFPAEAWKDIRAARAALADVSHLAAESQVAGSSKPIAVDVESPSAAQAQGAATPVCPQCRGLKYVGIPGDACQYCEGSGRDKYAVPEVAQEPPAPTDDVSNLAQYLCDLAALMPPLGQEDDKRAQLQRAAAALEAQRGEIERLERRQDCAVVEYAQVKRERDSARDLAAQLWAVVRAADAMRATRICTADWPDVGKAYDTLRAALLKDANA